MADDDTPEKYLEEKQLKEILSDIINKLDEREKLIVTLYYYEDLNMKEIAEILGYSIKSFTTSYSNYVKN